MESRLFIGQVKRKVSVALDYSESDLPGDMYWSRGVRQ